MSGKGLFISFEGGEGVGKSTQIRMLMRRLKGLGRQVEATREPGATALGRRVEEMVRSSGGQPPSPRAELMLYLADRAQHVEKVIRPALDQGRDVICDRFTDSSEVYQGVARGLDQAWVRQLNLWVCNGIWPDITFVLDLDPAEGLQRVLERQGDLGLAPDRLESEGKDFHLAVRDGFLKQAEAEPERIIVVDASRPREEVADSIWERMEQIIKG